MYNNPYNFYPYMNQVGNINMATNALGRTVRPGLFAAFRNIKWSSVLTNTQKTLNVINQAIPVYYQMKPIMNNIRSFGKIMTAFKEPDTNSSNIVETVENSKIKEDQDGPTFFIN